MEDTALVLSGVAIGVLVACWYFLHLHVPALKQQLRPGRWRTVILSYREKIAALEKEKARLRRRVEKAEACPACRTTLQYRNASSGR